MAVARRQGADDGSLFLEVKNFFPTERGSVDAERTTTKLFILVPVEENYFAACNKTKTPAGPGPFPFLSLLALNPSLKAQKEILDVGQEANPKWKSISYSPGRVPSS